MLGWALLGSWRRSWCVPRNAAPQTARRAGVIILRPRLGPGALEPRCGASGYKAVSAARVSVLVAGVVAVCALLVAGCSTRAQRSAASISPVQTSTSSAVTYNRSCEKTTFMSQVQLTACVGKELGEVQQQLNSALATEAKAWGLAIPRLVQARWLGYRNAYCKYFTGARGGTAYSMYFLNCQLGLTVNRLAEVRETTESH
jgi:uncharacterized protein YecT (DUF1311 family)